MILLAGSNGMHTPNEQLVELLSLTANSLSQLTEALTTYSFEMMASEDPAVRIASRRMVSRIALIQTGVGRQQHLISVLTGTPPIASGSLIELELQPPTGSEYPTSEVR